MENGKLNNLVISYQKKDCEETFSQIHEIISRYWRKYKVLYSIANKYRLDVMEVESLANEVIYETVGKYDVNRGDYYIILSVALSRKAKNLRRDTAKYSENETSLDASLNNDEEDSPIINFIVGENNVAVKQKKDDQRQLIAHLIDKAPIKSVQALKAYVETDYSFPEAAKLLGISYPAVRRRVEKIASYFDANQNGSIYDYFIEATA